MMKQSKDVLFFVETESQYESIKPLLVHVKEKSSISFDIAVPSSHQTPTEEIFDSTASVLANDGFKVVRGADEVILPKDVINTHYKVLLSAYMYDWHYDNLSITYRIMFPYASYYFNKPNWTLSRFISNDYMADALISHATGTKQVTDIFTKTYVLPSLKLMSFKKNVNKSKKPVILFAPTYNETDVSSSFIDAIDLIKKKYALSVRIHRRDSSKDSKGSARQHYHRRKYITRLRRLTKKASYLIAISQHTKNDFVKFVGIDSDKISVCHLGIADKQRSQNQDSKPKFEKYVLTSWGYVKRDQDLTDKTFLLFVGGADPRRKLVELVAAYNNLKAQGQDIYLILAGDTMKGALSIPNEELVNYLKNTSYLDDIYFLGFISDAQRDWLYRNALAFVYPSAYEGFGLPVLEAMQYGTPVITFNNSSIKEVAQDKVFYAKNFLDIANHVSALLKNGVSESQKQDIISYSNKYTWSKFSNELLKKLS